MSTKQKKNLTTSCYMDFNLNTKKGYLFIKGENKPIKSKKDINDILINLLNNSDSIIKNLENYIAYLSTFTLTTYDFPFPNVQHYAQIPVSSMLSLFFMLNLNFEVILGKDPNIKKEITEYIYRATHPNVDFFDDYINKKLDYFPNPNNEVLIDSLNQIVNRLKQFKDIISNVFIWNSKKKKYLYNKSKYIIPKRNTTYNKDNSKSYAFTINSLQDFYNASIYCINKSKLVIGKCIVCNSYYIDNPNVTTCSKICRNKLYASGTKSIRFKNSLEVATLLNKIRSYLNKTTLKDSEKNKLRKDLKVKFEIDYSYKVKELKSKYGQKYNSPECQSLLYNWLDESYEKFHKYFPSKKIGNTNAKK